MRPHLVPLFGLSSLCALSLILMGGCGTTSGSLSGEPTALTPATTAVTDASPVPIGYPTGYTTLPPILGLEPTAYPTIEPGTTREVPAPPTLVATGGPTVRKPKGDSTEAQDAVERWLEALAAIDSLHGSQNLVRINEDGSRQPMFSDMNSSLPNTDEWYNYSNPQSLKYRMVVHFERGDFTTLYDGKGAYRMWSEINEVYRPWPDAAHAYDSIDWGILVCLYPTEAEYSFVDRKELDGRNVIELTVKSGGLGPQGLSGTRVYLDEATYLPYRCFLPYSSRSVGEGQQAGVEHTFSKLEVNEVSDSEFQLVPPADLDTATIYEMGYWNGPSGKVMPVYDTIQEAQRQVGFALFEPKEGAKNTIATKFLVEKDGKRTPILSINNAILEGVYLPQFPNGINTFAKRLNVKLSEVQVTKIDIDDQPAEWRTTEGEDGTGSSLLRLEREGTQIEIQSETMEDAIEIARGLKRVK